MSGLFYFDGGVGGVGGVCGFGCVFPFGLPQPQPFLNVFMLIKF